LSVENTLVSKDATGIMFQNLGSGSAVGILSDVQVVNNGIGILALGTSNTTSTNLTVQNSVVVTNPVVGILAGGYSTVTVTNSTIANNGGGLEAQNAGALLWTSGSTVTGNATGLLTLNGGRVASSGKNSLSGNTSGNSILPTTPSTPSPPPPPSTNFLLDNNG